MQMQWYILMQIQWYLNTNAMIYHAMIWYEGALHFILIFLNSEKLTESIWGVIIWGKIGKHGCWLPQETYS